MLATTALIMPMTPAAVTVGTPHWTAEGQAKKTVNCLKETPGDVTNGPERQVFYPIEGTLNIEE